MATRCLTRVFDGEEEIVCLYRHYDGYSSRSKLRRDLAANGAGRMAAKIVGRFLENDIDIMPPGTAGVWEDYEYHVKCPTLAAIEAEKERGNHDGLPATIEVFAVCGGFGDRPRTIEPYVEDEEDRTDSAKGVS